MLGNSWTAWIGDSVPAGITNDWSLLKRNIFDFDMCFEEADGVVADGIYQPVRGINPETNERWTKCEFLTKNCATRDQQLSPSEVEKIISLRMQDVRKTVSVMLFPLK
jgi:hypothetical protein